MENLRGDKRYLASCAFSISANSGIIFIPPFHHFNYSILGELVLIDESFERRKKYMDRQLQLHVHNIAVHGIHIHSDIISEIYVHSYIGIWVFLGIFLGIFGYL